MTIRIQTSNEIREFDTLAEAATFAQGSLAIVYSAAEYADEFDAEAEGAYYWSTDAGAWGWADSEEEAYTEIIERCGDRVVSEDLLSPSEAAEIFAEALEAQGYDVRTQSSAKSSSTYISVEIAEGVRMELGFRTHSAGSQLSVNQLIECPISRDALDAEIIRFDERKAIFLKVEGAA